MRPLYQLYEEFRRHYEWETVPLREARSGSEEAAADLAKALITTAFVLNGGGLVALPAFFHIFDAGEWVVLIFIVLVLGIALAAAGGLCAFLAHANRANATYEQIKAAGHRSWGTIWKNAAAVETDVQTRNNMAKTADEEMTKAEEYEAAAGPFFNSYLAFRLAGILTVIGSFVCLVIGALLGIIAAW